MPAATQYQLSYQELTEAIIKTVGIHEGKWMLLVTFGFGAANIGPNENEVKPSAVASVQTVGIMVAEEGAPASLVVDAAVVNPAPARKAAKRV